MPKKSGILFIIAGAVLLTASLLLYLQNLREQRQAALDAQQALEQLQQEIVSATPTPTPEPSATPRPKKMEMPIREIDGNEYIGYVAVPALELELPVMADWSYDKLRVAPCRHTGATYTDDLVIAAHNYDKHFGKLKTLSIGDTITFTDMDGDVYEYQVEVLETVAPTAVEKVLESGYDLALYTCTLGGATRVVVFCNYKE